MEKDLTLTGSDLECPYCEDPRVEELENYIIKSDKQWVRMCCAICGYTLYTMC